MSLRTMALAALALATAVLMSAVPAGARSPARDGTGTATAGLPPGHGLPVPGLTSAGAIAGGKVFDDQFTSDSCLKQAENPGTGACQAVGDFASGNYVKGLFETWYSRRWSFPQADQIDYVTQPFEVSCVAQSTNFLHCVTVGEHYGALTDYKHPVQYAEVGTQYEGIAVDYRNPPGATWSVLDDVSCAALRFCMLVGADGTTRKTTNGLYYLSHASAYVFRGKYRSRLTVPVPAHSHGAELAGVSCATTTDCMAVGNYTSPAGHSLPFSARWVNGTWHLAKAPVIAGEAATYFQAVSCSAAAACIAVGNAASPGTAAFAEKYASGKWTVMPTVPRTGSAFWSVSCPTTDYCAAAGTHGRKSLLEAWNGTAWTIQTVPVTPAPFTTNATFHVSCITSTLCYAVGYQHDPSSRYSYKTLALQWNGTTWTVMNTHNL